MRWEDFRRSDQIEDRREQDPTAAGPGGFPVGGSGLGVGAVIVLGLIGWALGIDPRLLIGGLERLQGGYQQPYQNPQRPGPSTPARTGGIGLKVSPSGSSPTDVDTAAIVGADVGNGMQLGMKAGHTYHFSTWIFVPGVADRPVTVPANGAGTSIVALSDITSMSPWPR